MTMYSLSYISIGLSGFAGVLGSTRLRTSDVGLGFTDYAEL